MSIIKNTDIYDPKQGNPFEAIEKMFDILDKKVEQTKIKMQGLEKSLRDFNLQGNSEGAKSVLLNVEKLNKETEKLNAFQKAQITIKNQLETAEAKLAASVSNENRELAALKVNQQIVNNEQKQAAKLTSNLTGAYEKESIKLNQLRKQYKDLAVEQKHTTKEGKELLKNIQQLDAKLKQVDGSVGQFQRNVGNYRSALSNLGNTIKQFFIGGVIVGAISKIGQLINDSRILASQAAGTTRAFNELNRADLLDKMREATGGTISDIELMKKALDADDFKQNLDNLPLYFRFARKEVQETGGNVNDLVQTIVEGIGKESPKAVTKLGIPLKEFKEEMKKTGDYTEALNNIISERMKNAGTYIETAADVTARWAARWENMKTNAGSLLDTILVKISPVLETIWNALTSLWKTSTRFIIDTYNGFVDLYNESKLFRTIIESIGLTFDVLWETVKLFFSAFTGQLKAIGKTLAYTFNPANWGSGFKDGLGRILAENGQEIINNFKSFGKKIGEETFDAINNSMDGQMKKLTPEDFMLSGGTGSFTTQGGEGTGGGGGSQAQLDAIKNFNAQKQALELENLTTITALKGEASLEQTKILEEQLKKEAEIKDQEYALELQYQEQKRALIEETTLVGIESMAALAASGKLTLASFTKTLVLLALDSTEKFIELSLAKIYAAQIAEKGFLGIGTGAVLMALVKGLFGGIKARIQGFATGTDYVTGAGTETSDSIPAMLSKGERVVPAAINKQLMGIPNEKLPLVLNQNLQSLKMETMLNEIGLHTKLSAMYLSNGRNDWQDGNFKYYQDWKTGQIKRKLRD